MNASYSRRNDAPVPSYKCIVFKSGNKRPRHRPNKRSIDWKKQQLARIRRQELPLPEQFSLESIACQPGRIIIDTGMFLPTIPFSQVLLPKLSEEHYSKLEQELQISIAIYEQCRDAPEQVFISSKVFSEVARARKRLAQMLQFIDRIRGNPVRLQEHFIQYCALLGEVHDLYTPSAKAATRTPEFTTLFKFTTYLRDTFFPERTPLSYRYTDEALVAHALHDLLDGGRPASILTKDNHVVEILLLAQLELCTPGHRGGFFNAFRRIGAATFSNYKQPTIFERRFSTMDTPTIAWKRADASEMYKRALEQAL